MFAHHQCVTEELRGGISSQPVLETDLSVLIRCNTEVLTSYWMTSWSLFVVNHPRSEISAWRHISTSQPSIGVCPFRPMYSHSLSPVWPVLCISINSFHGSCFRNAYFNDVVLNGWSLTSLSVVAGQVPCFLSPSNGLTDINPISTSSRLHLKLVFYSPQLHFIDIKCLFWLFCCRSFGAVLLDYFAFDQPQSLDFS